MISLMLSGVAVDLRPALVCGGFLVTPFLRLRRVGVGRGAFGFLLSFKRELFAVVGATFPLTLARNLLVGALPVRKELTSLLATSEPPQGAD